MRHLLGFDFSPILFFASATTTAFLAVNVLGLAPAQAATQVQLNPGLYISGIDQKPVMKIMTDESGRTLQIEGPHVPATTLSLNENHNFDTTTAIDSGLVSREFVRRCTAKTAQEKPCFKGLYDTATGKLRVEEGDEYAVSARLLILSSDSVLEMQWTTWTRDGAVVAQKRQKEVLKWSPAAKSRAGAPGEPVTL